LDRTRLTGHLTHSFHRFIDMVAAACLSRSKNNLATLIGYH